MAEVIVTAELEKEVNKIFKGESVKVFSLMSSLKENPKKGKAVGSVGGITIKEIKYRNYRFYFITDKFKVKFLRAEELTDLLIRFVRMSDKDTQKKVIEEIKQALRALG